MNVLLADSNHVMRAVMRQILLKEGDLDIIEAADGEEAWQHLNVDITPDLCIIDLDLPKMDGLELLRKMRTDARFKETPVLVVTARNDKKSVLESISLKILSYIIKPYKADVLVAKVRSAKEVLMSKGTLLRSIKSAIDNLGLTNDQYFNLFDLFLGDIERINIDAAKALAQGNLKEVVGLFTGVLGSCQTLGAKEYGQLLKSFIDELEKGNAAINLYQLEQVREKLKKTKVLLQKELGMTDDSLSRRKTIGPTTVFYEAPKEKRVEEIQIFQVTPGMVLEDDIRSKDGLLLLGKGTDIDFNTWKKLQGFHHKNVIGDTLKISRK